MVCDVNTFHYEVTAPVGALPAITGLTLCWLYLLGCATELNKAIMYVINNEDVGSDAQISVFRLARECFGKVGGLIAAALFTVRYK